MPHSWNRKHGTPPSGNPFRKTKARGLPSARIVPDNGAAMSCGCPTRNELDQMHEAAGSKPSNESEAREVRCTCLSTGMSGCPAHHLRLGQVVVDYASSAILPLALAQRILAALQTQGTVMWSKDLLALAAELREVMPK